MFYRCRESVHCARGPRSNSIFLFYGARHSNQVGPVLGPRLRHDAGTMAFDRSGANVEFVGDLPVRKADDDIFEHLPFTWRQRLDLLCGLSSHTIALLGALANLMRHSN